MKKRSTKFLSLLLSLLMVVTILPAGTLTAQAADSRVENAISFFIYLCIYLLPDLPRKQ